jgi:CBS-domain-containing membrane protein
MEVSTMTRCGEIMKENPTCRSLDTSVHDLAVALKGDSTGPLPIVDLRNDKKLLGVVTCRDLVVEVLAKEKNAADANALDVINHQKQFCKTDDSIGRAITLMDKYHVTRLPVVDSSMHLVGTILQSDIAKYLEDPDIPLEYGMFIDSAEEEEVRTIL